MDQHMAKKETLSTQSEHDPVESGAMTSQSRRSLTREPQELILSEGQRSTILKYGELPAHLSERLAAKGTEAKGTQFTLDELDELLDHVEESLYRAKGNEKQKVLRIVEKVSKLLGSIIDSDVMRKRRLPTKADTVFQIKMTLRGIDPPIWRRIQTQECTLEELHALIQVTMGWEFEHLYRFNIGGVEYADLEMVRDEDVEDACATTLSEVLPTRNRRPRFIYEYDFGDEWIHQLIVEERIPPEEGIKYPFCLAGQRACPPEDCGGPWGYSDFVEAITNPDHRRHEETLEWVGGEFDLEKFDREAVNKELRRLRTGKT
jgi:Plasmid pRiA4b ORF-3-like protein